MLDVTIIIEVGGYPLSKTTEPSGGGYDMNKDQKPILTEKEFFEAISDSTETTLCGRKTALTFCGTEVPCTVIECISARNCCYCNLLVQLTLDNIHQVGQDGDLDILVRKGFGNLLNYSNIGYIISDPLFVYPHEGWYQGTECVVYGMCDNWRLMIDFGYGDSKISYKLSNDTVTVEGVFDDNNQTILYKLTIIRRLSGIDEQNPLYKNNPLHEDVKKIKDELVERKFSERYKEMEDILARNKRTRQ